MRERAVEQGLTVAANVEVLGIDVEGGRVRRVRTTRGDIECERLVIACGAWSPRIAKMAGASIPLTPMIHQMIDIGPAPRFANTTGMIEYPIVRDMDTNMYERQEGTGLEIGSYAHRPIMARRRRDPLDRGVGAQPDRDAVHPGRLRSADGDRARADAGDRRRRERRREVRDQRRPLGHATTGCR